MQNESLKKQKIFCSPTMSHKNWPIIIGAAQFAQPKETQNPLDPLNLIAKASKEALEDTGINNVNEFVDTLYLVYFSSWSYEDAPSELSKLLKINPSFKHFSSSGGNTSQRLLNKAALSISEGKSKMILIAGGEAWNSFTLNRKGKLDLGWPEKKDSIFPEGGEWKMLNDFESKYGLNTPSISYALFETALRAASGRSLEEHQRHIGKLYEQFSKVAANNPYTSGDEKLSTQEISTPTPSNRIINHPYTKYMCSNPFVDLSGAVLMTSQEYAEELNIEPSKWVYLMGGATLHNLFDITPRPTLLTSPAVEHASQLSLAQAGLKLEDIDMFDFYSCFPSMVQIIRNALNIKEDDPRPFTITGGMSFFGGPWNNYSMHPVATAVDLIRKDPSLKIMVVANGGYNTKESVGIYGNQPPIKSWGMNEVSAAQEEISKGEQLDVVEKTNGIVAIEAYTITYNKVGKPTMGIILGHLEDGSRTLAMLIPDSKTLEQLTQLELVGKKFHVFHDRKKGINYLKNDVL
jgi:acetyl-CoA C-acetyltransferase